MLSTADELIDRARASAGLTDLGADGWQEGLDRLLDAATRDLQLDPVTTARLEGSLEHRLVSRLRIEDWYRRREQPPPPLDGIVVIHGLPRTVATAQRNALPGPPPDPVQLGAFLLEHLAEGITRATAARAVIGEDRFLDVSQPEMEADAVKTAERIYDFLGLDLDPATRTAMADWAAANRRGARGRHQYTAEDYGLTTKRIRETFRDYIDRYQVAPEAEPGTSG